MSEKKKVMKIVIEYDGSNYHGWQCQTEGLATVQKTIENAIGKITGEKVKTRGSGRTDSGVHAIGQVASFTTATKIKPRTLQKALNGVLPDDISIVSAQEVAEGFDAQFSSRSKIYRYRIFNMPYSPALERNRAWHVRENLDVGKMKQGARCFEGTHDFSIFAAADITVRTSVRTVKRAAVRKTRQGIILFEIEADGFLKRMVRIITGALVETGKGKLDPEEITRMLEGRRRTKNILTAPAHGLFLKKVVY